MPAKATRKKCRQNFYVEVHWHRTVALNVPGVGARSISLHLDGAMTVTCCDRGSIGMDFEYCWRGLFSLCVHFMYPACSVSLKSCLQFMQTPLRNHQRVLDKLLRVLHTPRGDNILLGPPKAYNGRPPDTLLSTSFRSFGPSLSRARRPFLFLLPIVSVCSPCAGCCLHIQNRSDLAAQYLPLSVLIYCTT